MKLLDQSFELSVEGVVKQNSPSHCKIMDLKTYGVKSILSDEQKFDGCVVTRCSYVNCVGGNRTAHEVDIEA